MKWSPAEEILRVVVIARLAERGLVTMLPEAESLADEVIELGRCCGLVVLYDEPTEAMIDAAVEHSLASRAALRTIFTNMVTAHRAGTPSEPPVRITAKKSESNAAKTRA